MNGLLRSLRDARLALLMARAQRGDGSAFRKVYEALHPLVWTFVRRRVFSRADAEEIVAQTFFRLLDKLQSYDRRRATVAAYTLGIARNLTVDHLRSRSPETAAAPVEAATSSDPLDQLLHAESLVALQSGIQHLPPEAAQALVLRYADQLSYADMAAVLEISEAAARQRTSRAVRELRSLLTAEPTSESLCPPPPPGAARA